MHTVVQILETRHSIHLPLGGLVFCIQTCIEKSATIAALAIIGNPANQIRILLRTADSNCIIIRIGTLVAVVVVEVEIEFPTIRRKPDASQTSPTRLHLIDTLTCIVVLEEASATFVIPSCRESEHVTDAMIMCQGDIVVIVFRRKT